MLTAEDESAVRALAASAIDLECQHQIQVAYSTYVACLKDLAGRLGEGGLVPGQTLDECQDEAKRLQNVCKVAMSCLARIEAIGCRALGVVPPSPVPSAPTSTSQRATTSASTTSSTTTTTTTTAAGVSVTDDHSVSQAGEAIMYQAIQANNVLQARHADRMSKMPLTKQKESEMNIALVRSQIENMAIAKSQQQQLILRARKRKEDHLRRQRQMQRKKRFSKFTLQSETRKKVKQKKTQGPLPPPTDDDIIDSLISLVLSTDNQLGTEVKAQLVQFRSDHCNGELSLPQQALAVLSDAIATVHNLTHAITDILIANFPEWAQDSTMPKLATLAVEAAIHSRIYPDVFPLYIAANSTADQHLSRQCAIIAGLTPAVLQIPHKYWLADDQYPHRIGPHYSAALRTIQSLTYAQSAHEKLKCIVTALQATCLAVTEYWSSREPPKKESLGADDLIPVFAYLLSLASIPNIQSEVEFLSEFTNESVMIGEGGYALATLVTVVNYLSSVAIPSSS